MKNSQYENGVMYNTKYIDVAIVNVRCKVCRPASSYQFPNCWQESALASASSTMYCHANRTHWTDLKSYYVHTYVYLLRFQNGWVVRIFYLVWNLPMYYIQRDSCYHWRQASRNQKLANINTGQLGNFYREKDNVPSGLQKNLAGL